MKTFSETMQEIMHEHGTKAVDLYRDSDVLTQQYISKLMRNRFSDPTLTKAKAIFDALGVTANEFLERQQQDKAE